ncbi:MAG TPA: DNA methyltransferase [Polyangiaceae bacterium]
MKGQRRALTHVGGEVTREGAAEESLALARALDVPRSTGEDDDPSRAHVHGFHVYPARMHPVTAGRLIELTSTAGTKVLDPFCGSGTVVVSAMLARRDAIGVDLNPLAVLLTSRKVAPRDSAHDERLLAAAARVREHADARRTKKAGALMRYPAEDVAAFDPHVLLELDSVRDAIDHEKDGIVRDDLRVVLSAILVKVSRRSADTARDEAPKRIAAGYTAKLFQKKCDELVRRTRELAALMPSPRPRALVFGGDARELAKVRDGEAAAVVTSPPYAGTYDYVAHHALRLRWLGLPSASFEKSEIGSRRELGRGGPGASRTWEDQLGAALSAMRRALAPHGRAAFVIADSELGGRALRANQTFSAVAPRHGFRVVARAAQPRPHFHDARAFANSPRFEHAILLEKM